MGLAACAVINGALNVARNALACVGSGALLPLAAGFRATVRDAELIFVLLVSIETLAVTWRCAILLVATTVRTNRCTIVVIPVQTMIVLGTRTRSWSQARAVLATAGCANGFTLDTQILQLVLRVILMANTFRRAAAFRKHTVGIYTASRHALGRTLFGIYGIYLRARKI